MPKWRKLHTDIADDDLFNEMPDHFFRLLWVMLPIALDKHGRCKDNPSWIRSRLFPMNNDDGDLTAIEDALNWYSDNGLIERYEIDGRAYFWRVNWQDEQGNTSAEAESKIPPPPSWTPPWWEEHPRCDTAYWQEIRAEILERDGYVCQYCGEVATAVDHILPKRRGGGEELRNLVASCKSCNSKKGARTPEEAGMEIRNV